MQSGQQSQEEEPNFYTPASSTLQLPTETNQQNNNIDRRGSAATQSSAQGLRRPLSSTSNRSQDGTIPFPSADPQQPALRRPPPMAWRPSIHIRRRPSVDTIPGVSANPEIHINAPDDEESHQPNRRRSSSEPQRMQWGSRPAGMFRPRASSLIPDTIHETPSAINDPAQPEEQPLPRPDAEAPPLQHFPTYNGSTRASPAVESEYDSDLVDFLDLVGSYRLSLNS